MTQCRTAVWPFSLLLGVRERTVSLWRTPFDPPIDGRYHIECECLVTFLMIEQQLGQGGTDHAKSAPK